NFPIGDLYLFGFSGQKVPSLYGLVVRWGFQVLGGRSYLYLYGLGGTLPHIEFVLGPHIIDDVVGEDIPGDFHGFVTDDPSQGDHGDLGGPAPYVHDHVPLGLHDIQADADGGGHGFVDQINLLAVDPFGGFPYRPHFHFGDPRGDADYHAKRRGEPFFLQGRDILDEHIDHLFRGIEVGDDPVLERPNGLNVLMGLSLHHTGLASHCDDLSRYAVPGHDGWTVHDHLVLVDDQGVCGSEVNGDLLGHEVKKSHKKSVCYGLYG